VREAVAAASAVTPERARSLAIGRLGTLLADAGFISQAAEVLRESKDENKRGWALLALAKAEVKAGRLDEALELAQKIRPGFGQRAMGITHVVTAAANAGRPLPRPNTSGESPSSPNDRRAVVEGLAAAGKADAAAVLAREITDRAAGDLAWLPVAVAFTRAKDFAQARTTADQCVSPQYRLAAYTQILTLLAIERNPALGQKRPNAGTLF